MVFRDLEKIRSIIKDATGLDLTYAYEDLVFPEHVAFLVRFDEQNTNIFYCYFHEDCIPDEKDAIFDNLAKVSETNKCTMIQKGAFNLKQKGEEVEVHFL